MSQRQQPESVKPFGWRVEPERIGDRWTFVVGFADADWRIGWRLDGVDDEQCLANPVFQYCVAASERRGSSESDWLLMGQVGRRVFSGALNIRAEEVRLEIADRIPDGLLVEQLQVTLTAARAGIDVGPAVGFSWIDSLGRSFETVVQSVSPEIGPWNWRPTPDGATASASFAGDIKNPLRYDLVIRRR